MTITPSTRRNELLDRLKEVQEFRNKDGRGYSFRKAIGARDFKVALELLEMDTALDELIYSISQIEVLVGLEEFLIEFAPTILKLSDDQRAEFGRKLLSLSPESAIPFAILSGSSFGPPSAATEAISRLRQGYSAGVRL